MARPLLLLTNDDGCASPGLAALGAALHRLGDVVVCAPEHNQSAVSHGLTLHEVLRLREVSPAVYALDGTPADCVYVALNAAQRLLPRRPELVVSGINHGPNLGVDINYSGTVAAAREAALRGLPAVAVSAHPDTPLDVAAAVGTAVARAMLDELAAADAPADRPPLLLNVNVPPAPDGALRLARQGGRPYQDRVVFRTDPRGRDYLWIGSGTLGQDEGAPPDSDTAGFHGGSVTVTPLTVDLTAQDQWARCERLLERCRRG